MLWKQIKNNKLAIGMGIILSSAYAAILVKGTDVISKQIDILLSTGVINDYSFISHLMLMAVLGFLASFFSRFLVGRAAILSVSKIKSNIATVIPDIPYGYFSNNGTGGMVNKLVSDIEQVRMLLEETFPSAVTYTMTILVTCCYIAVMDIRILPTIIIFYPLMLFISDNIAKKLGKLAKKRASKNDKLADMAIDAVSGIECVKANNLDNIVSSKMGEVIDDILANECERTKVSSMSWGLQMFIKWIPMIICMLQILFETINGALSVGSAFASTILLNKMVHPMSVIPFVINDYKEASISVERIEKLMNLDKESGGDKVLYLKKENSQALEFSNVKFGYSSEKSVLKGISFRINKGEKAAFVGPSGSGKSTIFRLLVRYYDYDNGKYSIWGNDSQVVTVGSLRDQFAVVSQNTFLFPETIYENVAVGNPSATREDVIKCCKKAGLNQFIEKLDKGYDTIVGEKGCMLSGGQRQRISIARALLKDAPIVLLDEPTASIDEENEKKIQQMINELLSDKTVIYIAHRLSTIKDVDKIFVLENGKIVQEGSHNELIAQDGIYSSLYKRESESV